MLIFIISKTQYTSIEQQFKFHQKHQMINISGRDNEIALSSTISPLHQNNAMTLALMTVAYHEEVIFVMRSYYQISDSLLNVSIWCLNICWKIIQKCYIQTN